MKQVYKIFLYLDTLTLGSGSAQDFGDFGVSWLLRFWVHILDVSKMSKKIKKFVKIVVKKNK